MTTPIWLGPVSVHLPAETVAVAALPEVAALPAARRDHVLSLGIDEIRCLRDHDGRPGPGAEVDLAAAAAQEALNRAGLAAEDVDALILVQGRAPRYLLASEATRLQARLGAIRATTLSVGDLGCVSVSAALDVGVALLRGRPAWRHVLVAMGAVAATEGRYRPPMTVLGDAGAAVLLGREPGRWGWLDHAQRSDGSYADLFHIDYRDVPARHWRETCADEPTYSFRLAMESRSRLRDLNREVLAARGLTPDRLDAVLMQNLSRGAFAFWQGALGVTIGDACPTNLARYGHLGPIDVLANLDDTAATVATGGHVLVMNSSPVAAWSSALLVRGTDPR
ncbi:3-oxoacyl-ACP synthase [Micromonospora endolithica]|uniref:3-oxoacyl-ACP synthase n=1 Tax=Micromonospora endolithica TaxID=230091 RepID=A0A3A9ZAK0_9ACTN|nr:3-oxoacyl-ACP synthase [Micromonospora endolithica]RKN45343.1 3-oxoacyl-ACP synthase [Micromonospora endolithica]TWJ22959.1 3-oxoacyl-[acyl-carrier-protein] synthase-3 [Micromonospora endolithica]